MSNVIAKKTPKGRNIKRALLLPRTNEAFLGDEWSIITMDNHAAYLPQERAAHDLEAFYVSLATIALHPVFGPGSYIVHRINRVLITFHCQGMIIPHELVLRFANGMLGFTRMGYTSAYRMQFRHETLGYVLTVTLSADDPPPEPGAMVCEAHEQVNASDGVRQICIMRPPSFPGT
ncbi:MAG: hypothetical protein LQ346_005230 [Caloplaca aetnensis]|nr:MAG: hypothetical protein LQ346_005230 [Caloplaca aetnensis]